jgi:tellurite methyltransferase
MNRAITGFRIDDTGDWIALLNCGHGQHVRHKLPFTRRPWVTTEEGRNGMLGEMLNCVRCDRFELPDHFIAYQKTPTFTEHSIPLGLKKDHTTKTGIWAKIMVTEGRLLYQVAPLDMEFILSQNQIGIVIPAVLHCVAPLGAVHFFVEFYRSPDPG